MTETSRGNTVIRERVQKFFDPDTVDSEPTLVGSQCRECGKVHFPKVQRCMSCYGDTREHQLSRTGTLYTFSPVTIGPPQFNPPYTIGYVDLPDGIRIFSKIRGDNFGIGDEMEVDVDIVAEENGEQTLGYVFEKTKGER